MKAANKAYKRQVKKPNRPKGGKDAGKIATADLDGETIQRHTNAMPSQESQKNQVLQE